jgi:hypothetical protein
LKEIKRTAIVEVTKAKREFYSKKYENSIGNSRETWKITTDIIRNKKSSCDRNEIELMINGRLNKNPAVIPYLHQRSHLFDKLIDITRIEERYCKKVFFATVKSSYR